MNWPKVIVQITIRVVNLFSKKLTEQVRNSGTDIFINQKNAEKTH